MSFKKCSEKTKKTLSWIGIALGAVLVISAFSQFDEQPEAASVPEATEAKVMMTNDYQITTVTLAETTVAQTQAVTTQTSQPAEIIPATEAVLEHTSPETALPAQKKVIETQPYIPASPQTGIELVSLTSPAFRNNDATIMIKGKPNTQYSIVVRYKSGASKASGLESKVSDGNGNVSWTWKVGGKTALGKFSISVSGGGETATYPFEVGN